MKIHNFPRKRSLLSFWRKGQQSRPLRPSRTPCSCAPEAVPILKETHPNTTIFPITMKCCQNELSFSEYIHSLTFWNNDVTILRTWKSAYYYRISSNRRRGLYSIWFSRICNFFHLCLKALQIQAIILDFRKLVKNWTNWAMLGAFRSVFIFHSAFIHGGGGFYFSGNVW